MERRDPGRGCGSCLAYEINQRVFLKKKWRVKEISVFTDILISAAAIGRLAAGLCPEHA